MLTSISKLYAAVFLFTCLTSVAEASLPTAKVEEELEKILMPLSTQEAWKTFLEKNVALCGKVGPDQKDIYVGVDDVSIKVDGDEHKVGRACRSVLIQADVKSVMNVISNPEHFQALYGLDKTAFVAPKVDEGHFQSHIYKPIPGIAVQDYTLDYAGHWDGDAWIQHAKMLKDERNFAIRSNVAFVEPVKDKMSIYHEVALFISPLWWVNLMHGTVQNITQKELTRLNKAIRCAAEKSQKAGHLDDDIAKECHKVAEE